MYLLWREVREGEIASGVWTEPRLGVAPSVLLDTTTRLPKVRYQYMYEGLERYLPTGNLGLPPVYRK